MPHVEDDTHYLTTINRVSPCSMTTTALRETNPRIVVFLKHELVFFRFSYPLSGFPWAGWVSSGVSFLFFSGLFFRNGIGFQVLEGSLGFYWAFLNRRSTSEFVNMKDIDYWKRFVACIFFWMRGRFWSRPVIWLDWVSLNFHGSCWLFLSFILLHESVLTFIGFLQPTDWALLKLKLKRISWGVGISFLFSWFLLLFWRLTHHQHLNGGSFLQWFSFVLFP